MRLRHRLAIVASLAASSFVTPTLVATLPQAHAMSINCAKVQGGWSCEVIHDNGTTEYFFASER